MKCSCSDVERVLPELLDGEPDAALESTVETRPDASDIEAHLKSCPACSELVSDLKLISSQARELAASEEPAPRLWVRIAAELRAEGLIREPESEAVAAPTRPLLVPTSPRWRWSLRWLAPVAAAILAAGSYVISHRTAPQVDKDMQPAITTFTSPPTLKGQYHGDFGGGPSTTARRAAENTATSPANQSSGASPQQLAQEAEPSEEDRQFLSAVSTRAPSMRATYESQLKAVNDDIRETQAYVDLNPGDADARQHLMEAYQQKALLYEIALDRIQ